MRIKLQREHRSIKVVEPTEFALPDFAVLTGKNGSGKTHLLEMIADTSLTEVKINGRVITNIKYVTFNGFAPVVHGSCDGNLIHEQVAQIKQEICRTIQRGGGNSAELSEEENMLNRIHNEGHKQYLAKILSNTKKPFRELTEEDFEDNFEQRFVSNNDLFTSQLAVIFKEYHNRFIHDKFKRYLKHNEGDENVVALEDEEFKNKYRQAPWDLVNSIFEECGIPYKVNAPEGNKPELSYELKLVSTDSDVPISSNDLSTGEKVLVSMALALYNTNAQTMKPDLLVLDEPDAPLHPSMMLSMVNILRDKIVNDAGVGVIMTTHSPVTVIASEGIALFEKVKGVVEPVKISRSHAVQILSGEIPFLHISDKRKIQIFVESNTDVQIFNRIYNAYSGVSQLGCHLSFVSARSTLGSNCKDVVEIVRASFQNGQGNLYGIIDRDISNVDEGHIIVLGGSERYAIENYILDPLLIALFGIKLQHIEISSIPSQVDFASYIEIQHLTKVEAQILVDMIIGELNFEQEKISSYSTYSGLELHIPEEFCNLRGHDLADLYREKFGWLSRYQDDKKMMLEVVKIVIDDYPELAPKALFETFEKCTK